LRKIIDSYYKSIGQRKTKKKIEDILNRLNINGFQKTRLLDILSESGAKSFPLVLRESRIKGKFDDPRYSIQMLSRAFLLLRLATGASMKLMEDNHLSKSDIEFWWNPFGHDHGLWDANYTNPLLDMWVDVEDALNRLQSNSAPATYLEGRAINARDILTLGGCERVGLSIICL